MESFFRVLSFPGFLGYQRRKKRTRPPPKENLLENFSGLKQKLSRPVVDTKTLQKPGKPYLPPKSFLCCPHFFSANKSSSLEQGGVPLSTQFIHIIFPQNISRYRVGEQHPINSPQKFSRQSPVTKKKKPFHWSGMSIQPSGKFGL